MWLENNSYLYEENFLQREKLKPSAMVFTMVFTPCNGVYSQITHKFKSISFQVGKA